MKLLSLRLNDFITNNKLDFLFLSETWLKVGDLTPLVDLLPLGYSYFNSPRLTGRGGGLMSIFKNDIECQIKHLPWVNEPLRVLRQHARQAERRWKKHKLQVNYEIFRESLETFQMASRDAKHKYYSNVIAQHVNDPKILFKVINLVINPMHTRYPDPSILNCEDFLNFFNDKIVGLHSTIPKLPVTPSCDLAVLERI